MAENNRAWVLVQRPIGGDIESALQFQDWPMPEPADGEVLVRTLYLSLDPANRPWMTRVTYLPMVPLDAPMWGFILGKVVKSKVASLQPGDIVGGLGSWSDYCAIPAATLNRMPALAGFSLSDTQSLFRGSGGTAYVGVIEVGQVKAGQIFVVSGAAGSVGSLAGQIAKIEGATVIGIAGSAEKCAWLTSELGFDHAIDYRNEDVEQRLAEICPQGVDVYFENVGGRVGNAVAARLAKGGRIVVCGLIAQYNTDEPVVGLDLLPIVLNGCTVRGFTLFEYLDRLGEASTKLREWVADGRLKYYSDIVDGLENARDAFKKLFEPGASHKGKLMVRVDPSAD